jgi:hypothetical protein
MHDPAERAFGEPQNREDVVTVTVTLPAPSENAGQRHRVVGIGSGLGGLIAIKALKLTQLNITDALVFLMGLIAHRASHLVSHTSLLVQFVPATAAVGAVGVIVTLSVAVVAELTKHRVAQALCHTGLRHLAKGWL